MTSKQAPPGICDLCGGEIPPHLGDYTSKGRPRLYCSIDCRNAANSRAGNAERTRKLRERVARGEWQNPSKINPPDPANIGAGVSRTWKERVKAGTWRNPALDDAAREKLSRPRKHGDNPVLHRAIEKLRARGGVSSLTPEERRALRAKWQEVWRHRKKR